jgi:hypothetical protein
LNMHRGGGQTHVRTLRREKGGREGEETTTSLPAYLPIFLSAYLPICLSAYLPICLSAYLRGNERQGRNDGGRTDWKPMSARAPMRCIFVVLS